ncbi:MAG: nitroreductase/quinone reductase family protein [Rhodoglobus sp.]
MDAAALDALARDRVIDITTIGRTSGKPSRIEIWFHRVGDRYFITGLPGRRDWYANLEANPAFTFHLKHSTTADLLAHARPITDPDERRAILTPVVGTRYNLEEWMLGSPLVEVTFDA